MKNKTNQKPLSSGFFYYRCAFQRKDSGVPLKGVNKHVFGIACNYICSNLRSQTAITKNSALSLYQSDQP